MTPDDERTFELLHGLRAAVAAWWLQARHTHVDLGDPSRFREKRRLEDSAFYVEELAAGYAWSVPTEADIAPLVLPPVEPDPSLTLPFATLTRCFDSRVVRLLHVATGGTLHIEEPVAWMRAQEWCVYRVPIEGRRIVQHRAARSGAWRLVSEDPSASTVFGHLCRESWASYLTGLEWELVVDEHGDVDRHQMRSPSGAVYRMEHAVDVALARGGFDFAAEIARGTAAVKRALARTNPEKATKAKGEAKP